MNSASIDDFQIIEYRDRIGGRAWKTDFGQDERGDPYSIELGANWVCNCRLGLIWISDFDLISRSKDLAQKQLVGGSPPLLSGHIANDNRKPRMDSGECVSDQTIKALSD